MGDNAEFEKLTVLEARLAAALERIATGLGDHLDAGSARETEATDPDVTSGAMEDALARTAALETQVEDLRRQKAALEVELGEARSADPAAVSSGVTAEERAAMAADLQAAIDGRDAEIALKEEAQAELASVADRLAAVAPMEGQSQVIQDLKAQVDELTAHSETLRSERDAAQAALAEHESASSAEADDLATLRAEAEQLRHDNEALAAKLAEHQMQTETSAEPDREDALLAELEAMRAARASEAAELARILQDIEVGGAAAASGGDHA